MLFPEPLADDRDELAWFYIQVDVRKRGNRVGLAPRYVKETFSSSIIALAPRLD